MFKRSFLASWILALLVVVGVSCREEEVAAAQPEVEKDYFVSAKLITELPQSILVAMADRQGFPQIKNDIKYDVQVYNVTYLTTYKGKEIEASGLLCVPKNAKEALPILSGQHGTTFTQAGAPTNFPAVFSGFELFASAGYLTLIPDYIGYGVSKQIFHPYYDQKHSALAVVDFIKAAKSYAKKNSLTLNDKLFLTGYSEGGYVTMAAQKEIETNSAHKLKVTASAAGAGGFDLTGMLGEISESKPYSNPNYLAFILQSYNKTYDWNRPMSDFFQEPYATNIPGLFNGINSAGTINRALTSDPTKLFSPTFYANLQKSDGELALKKALVANSIYTNWVPATPTKIYQGTADQSVFFENSKTTYDKLKAAGAKDLEFITIQGGTHSSSVEPMMLSVIPWFRSLK
ncbi:alpha/beta hydrolase family protein [Adhaeribacter aquaticus]|uniref:alpha/beta hydrolase family protein n=1 Tax=Adhaeribacter aquaticus TaxID=299567 RepID=UPI0003F698E9|nr:prolyl oligopeptidase family serine peptidase [Adhaeribacter aquaticus]